MSGGEASSTPESSVRRTRYQKTTKQTIHRSELKNAPYNPRKINRIAAKRLRGSIQSHGLVGGVVWNKRTGHIVGGHQRIAQLDELEGSPDYMIEVDVVDIDEIAEKELNIALNNRTMHGEFDDDMLAGVIQDLVDAKRNVERTGFTMFDVQEMLGDVVLAGEAAEQRDAEADVLAELDEIRQIAREDDGPASYGGEPLPSDTTGREPAMVIPTPPSENREQHDSPPAVDPRSTPAALAQRRVDYVGEVRGEVDSDTMLTLVFSSDAMREQFQRHFKIDRTKRYIDRFEIEAAFGVDMGDWQ